MRAPDLGKAINRFSPDAALSTPEDLKNYFVERPTTPYEKIKALVLATEKPVKLLFTGHRGSGKSTELAKLGFDLQDQYFVVRISVKQLLNLFNLSYMDIIFIMTTQLLREADGAGVKLSREITKELHRFTQDITRETEISQAVESDAEAGVKFLSLKLSSKFRTEESTRTIIRQRLSPRIDDLLQIFNLVALHVRVELEKPILMILEDLDKTDLAVTKELFYQHGRSLTEPDVSIIFTFPIEMLRDPDCNQIRTFFGKDYVLPNIKTHKKDGKKFPEGIARLKKMLHLRAEKKLFVRGSDKALALASGGNPRELMALARTAAVEALVAGRTAIHPQDVQAAFLERRIQFQALLTSGQLTLLESVRDTQSLDNSDEHKGLLHNLSVLEYRNDDLWYRVHPAAAALLPPPAATAP